MAGLTGHHGGRWAPATFAVAFVGGWVKAIFGGTFGSPSLPQRGIAAASVVTFSTFLPSFAFILLGGPFIESTHGNMKFTAPLTGITAAVASFIVNLTVHFFAHHLLWPRGFGGPFECASLEIGAGASLALFRIKVGVIPVVLASVLPCWLWQLGR